MVTPSPSTLVHSVKKPNWRIDVHRPEGVDDVRRFTVFLTGVVAPDFHRSRFMEMGVFIGFTRGVLHAREQLPDLLADIELEDVPLYPDALDTVVAENSMFRIHFALSRECCSVEQVLAIYDADGDTAPMLIATDAEIGELCRDCSEVLAHFGIEQPAV